MMTENAMFTDWQSNQQ